MGRARQTENPTSLDPAELSFWLASIEASLSLYPALTGKHRTDVAIVGAGYAGLWTAYYLKRLDPGLTVTVVEAAFAGRGAAGRNGGWCSLDFANYLTLLQNDRTRAQAIELMPHLVAMVDVVGDVIRAEHIDCDYHRGGLVHAAVSPAQLERARALHEAFDQAGLGDVHEWLERPQLEARVRISGSQGGVFSPHGAVLHPAKLARGLARTVVEHGTHLFEATPALEVGPGFVTTAHGRITADKVILATEGYTASSRGLPRRRLMAMHSFMTVTEPLTETVFDEIGLRDREAFGDMSWLATYGQRTADNRLAFGYGGRSYADGRPRDVFAGSGAYHRDVHQQLERLFPALKGVRYEQDWGGAMGMSRDLTPFVEYDPDTATGWLGGFFGNGVAATNLGGRAMADLVLGRTTDLTALSLMVRATSKPLARYRRWEPPAIAWSASNGLLKSLRLRDRIETGG